MTPELKRLYTIRWHVATKWGEPDAQADVLELLGQAIGDAPEKPIAVPDPVDDTLTISGPSKARKVALVVGHNSRQPGAWVKDPLNESEYVFNNKVAEIVMADGIKNVEMRRFNRVYAGSYPREIDRVYKKVNDWDPDFVFELHFNGSKGNYTCMLAAKDSSISRRIAGAVSKLFAEALGTVDKGVFARTRGERGGRSLYAARAPMVMTEPFFGDNLAHARLVGQIGHQGIADIYRAAIVAALSHIE